MRNTALYSSDASGILYSVILLPTDGARAAQFCEHAERSQFAVPRARRCLLWYVLIDSYSNQSSNVGNQLPAVLQLQPL